MKRTLALSAAATVATALVLTGCSSSGDSESHSSHGAGSSMSMPSGSSSVKAGAAASGPHNDADASFARDMVPHHRQAVEMADMALATSKDADVLRLARQIKSAQAPEIAKMVGWLEGWDQPVPAATGMGDAGHTGHTMNGMMTSEDMAALSKATGTAFDTLFLTMMIAHHQGAVAMANTELSKGRNVDATSLARSIVATQTAEIATMTKLVAAR